jgi:hypothetical protein
MLLKKGDTSTVLGEMGNWRERERERGRGKIKFLSGFFYFFHNLETHFYVMFAIIQIVHGYLDFQPNHWDSGQLKT